MWFLNMIVQLKKKKKIIITIWILHFFFLYVTVDIYSGFEELLISLKLYFFKATQMNYETLL